MTPEEFTHAVLEQIERGARDAKVGQPGVAAVVDAEALVADTIPAERIVGGWLVLNHEGRIVERMEGGDVPGP